MAECSVVILNFNGKDTIVQLLESVIAQTELPAEVLVLDNCSTDGSDSLAESWCLGKPGFTYHQFDTNLGFARAMNWGISQSKSEFICLLNADILLGENYLHACITEMKGDDRIGMACGVLYRLVKGKKTFVIDSLGIALNKSRYHDDIEAGKIANTPITTVSYPFGVGGCAPVYSRKMLSDISQNEPPFLEMFESYYEDVDLAWRARRMGWKAVCTGKTQAWHVREGALKGKKLKTIARNRNHRNRIWLMVLNERSLILMSHFFYWFPLQTFFLLKAFVQPGLFLAYGEMVRGLPKIFEIRKKRLKRKSILSLTEELKLFSKSKSSYMRRIALFFISQGK